MEERSTDVRTASKGGALRRIAPARLDDFIRAHYFDCELDIGSSGVYAFSLPEVCRLTGLELEAIGRVALSDSDSLGSPALRQAIAERFAGGDAGRVMATHGSSEAIFLIIASLLEAGDEVVAPAPCYQQLVGIAESIGCEIKHLPLRIDEGFRVDLGRLRSLIGPRTRLVIANFPHNPTGTTISRDEQDELLDIVAAAGSYLLWDGAFAELVYDQPPLPDPSSRYERALSIGTLSKAYGLPGLRVGWCIAEPALFAPMIRLRDYITLALSPLVETVATAVLEAGDRLVERRREEARANRAHLADWMTEHAARVEFVPARGGVTAFPRFREIADLEPFCHRLAAERGVLLLPGNSFGEPAHARLGFGGPRDRFATALGRLSEALRAG